MRENGLNRIPDVKDMPSTVNMPHTTASFSFLFNYHNHPLSLVAEHHDDDTKIMHEEEEDENVVEATDDELMVCDVCVTPISSPPYYECASCKYFIHAICYLLPKTFSSSSSPNIYSECTRTHDKNHEFTLYTSSELLDMNTSLCKCEICGFITNGTVYKCEGCEMKIDVKCASLPTSIRHKFHTHHKHLVLNRIPSEGGKRKHCHGCGFHMKKITYCCSSKDCDFELVLRNAMLPASITRHEWDKYHSLMLLSDAALDHPSGFICDLCEVELHPKGWMYHCRQCDLSFHLDCLESASGLFRNIKFGRRFMMRGIHPNHPLTFSCVTIKRRCDLCYMEVYNNCGLECASCYFVVCLSCGRRELAKKM
ncbi:uncharacterized protein LOC125207951 isoform X1 [Salvia hispanica]|uniref:uncharacterized protein LOC125207951 isoform X1 n=1 Tax=Salvia hispanica TaxID=49212 RepID=UPI002009457D|nr:uncharacterized protein LOC125207951 isoform X1 [Salvia hispanica]